MGWTPIAEAEAALGTRLARKLASGDLPTYCDARGERWVWLQQEHGGRDDVLWEVLAELRRVREALGRLEAQVQQDRDAAPRAGRVMSMTTGAFRRLEALLEPPGDAEAA